MDLQSPTNAGADDSACSTPFVGAPSSPGRSFFFSAPSSPTHYILFYSSPSTVCGTAADSPDFEFSARSPSSPSTAADELFLNGQIRPLISPSPLPFGLEADANLRCRSARRRARSLSPSRNPLPLQWPRNQEPRSEAQTPSVPATASRSSSSSSSTSSSSSSSTRRTSKRWLFIKDLILHRSKSEGSRECQTKEKFWHAIPFAKPPPPQQQRKRMVGSSLEVERAVNGDGQRRRRAAVPSAHERHYTENRAQAEEMRRRTALPYGQQGILGCLGFRWRNYGVINRFASTAYNTVYSGS